MANYKLKTQINNGTFKGMKVEDIILTKEGREYLLMLHESKKYNVKLTSDVLCAMGKNF